MVSPCEIKDQAAQPTLFVRARTAVQDLPQFMGRAYGAVMQYIGQQGAHPAGPPFAAYYNMDLQDPNAQSFDVAAGFPVSRPLPGAGEVQAGELPAGQVATCLYTGPYPEMGVGYEALTRFVQESGREPTGIAYEYYLNDPGSTPPQDLQTQIFFPLQSTE